MKIERRAFLQKTGAAVACACVGCEGVVKAFDRYMASEIPGGYRVEDSKLIIDLTKYPKLKETGGWATFKAAEKKIIVLCPAEQSYKAFENKCTHKGGELSYGHKDGFMLCALHGSRFDTNGGVVKGPAEKPLPEFKTTLDKDELTVYLA